MPGQGALRRNRIRKAQEKKERQKAAKEATKAGLITIPAITEVKKCTRSIIIRAGKGRY